MNRVSLACVEVAAFQEYLPFDDYVPEYSLPLTQAEADSHPLNPFTNVAQTVAESVNGSSSGSESNDSPTSTTYGEGTSLESYQSLGDNRQCTTAIFQVFPTTLDQTALAYLQCRHAFIRPQPAFQTHLLLKYIRHVHSVMPVLDIHQLVSTITQDTSSVHSPTKSAEEKPQIPYLLYQAVMFSAVKFADGEALKSAGYDTVNTAQLEMLQRARVSAPGHGSDQPCERVGTDIDYRCSMISTLAQMWSP